MEQNMELAMLDCGDYVPFSKLPFSFLRGIEPTNKIIIRLIQIVKRLPYHMDTKSMGWVKHKRGYCINIGPDSGFNLENLEENIAFTFDLGYNQNAYSRLKKLNPGWLSTKNMEIDGVLYPHSYSFLISLKNGYSIKHTLSFSTSDLIDPIKTEDDFFKLYDKIHSVRTFKKDSYAEIERLLDEIFIPIYDWRNCCGYFKDFLSASCATTISLKPIIYATLHVPFDKFREVDKDPDDIIPIAEFVEKIIEGMGKGFYKNPKSFGV